MVSIRDEMSHSQDDSTPSYSPPFPARYISSQYLIGSSLTADVSQYDFSFTAGSPKSDIITGNNSTTDVISPIGSEVNLSSNFSSIKIVQLNSGSVL